MIVCRALAIVVLLGIAVTACSPVRVVESVDLLSGLAAGEAAPPQGTDRRTVSFEVDGRRYVADRYRGEADPLAALIVVPGAAPQGKDDPRLVSFASTMARARFSVLVPDLPDFREFRLRASNVQAIGDAIRFYSDATGTEEIGVIAISYAAGPAILAALEPGNRHRVRVVVAIGGYYDMEAAVTYFTTGYYRVRPGAPWRYRKPNRHAVWVLLQSATDLVADPQDSRILSRIAKIKRRDPDADTGIHARALGPEGRSVLALVENRDPGKVPGLIAVLPAALRENFYALDLSRRDLSGLAARLILIHGKDDPVIPFTESRALAAAVPAHLRELYEVDRLAHVTLDLRGIGDGLTLLKAVYSLLRARDEMPAPRHGPPG